MDDAEDLPLISLSGESMNFEPPAPKPPAPAPAKKAPIVKPPTDIQRPAGEVRRPATEIKLPPAPVRASHDAAGDDDPEKLLREYQERQKRKTAALEQQVVELRRASAERDAYRSKSETLGRELLEAKKQLEVAAKQAEQIKELQHKIDAALLSHGMISTENAKLKMRVQELEAAHRRLEEKAAASEKALAEAHKAHARDAEARKGAEAKIAAVLKALQDPASGEAPSGRAALSASDARPGPAPVKK